MKKERYFRHELERMFIAYAIVPAVVFTLVCGLLWLVALLTRSLLRLPGVEYVYPFLRFAGDQHAAWLWNKAALAGLGLLWWVIYWFAGKGKE